MMEEQTHLQASRSGYKGHVTRLFNKIDELIDGEFDEYTTTSLTNAVEQFTRKMEKLSQIDEQLLKTFQNASELKTVVLDAEELQDEIMDKITRTRRYIELSTMKQPGRILPTRRHLVEHAIITVPANQLTVTSQAADNEPGLEPVSTTQNSDNPTSVISTTAQQHSISGTSTAHHIL